MSIRITYNPLLYKLTGELLHVSLFLNKSVICISKASRGTGAQVYDYKHDRL